MTQRDPLAANMRRHLSVLAALALLAAAWCWIELRSLRSRRSAFESGVLQLTQMREDVAAIQSLQSAPRLAVDRERPNDELLAEIRQALTAASIPVEAWVGNEPAPPVRLAQTPYKQISLRLFLEGLSLRQLADFAVALSARTAGLSFPSVRLSPAAGADKAKWNADLKMTYLIYAPV